MKGLWSNYGNEQGSLTSPRVRKGGILGSSRPKEPYTNKIKTKNNLFTGGTHQLQGPRDMLAG